VFLCLLLTETRAQDNPFNAPKPDSVTQERFDTSNFYPDAIMLGEAVILPYKTYAEFKRAFLDLDNNREAMQTAKKNTEIIQKQILLGVTPKMDAYENFRNRYTYNLIRPPGFVIISTNPNQGVLPLIRKAMGKE
jgi:hypothetical protein